MIERKKNEITQQKMENMEKVLMRLYHKTPMAKIIAAETLQAH